MTLRIDSVNGSPINEYRICGGKVELRTFGPAGEPYPGDSSKWRTLDEDEIELHHALETVVSVWMRVRLGVEAYELDKAA
jgi:hypothetical protein